MNEQAIFLAALDIADPAERAAFVKQTCAGAPTLLQQVDALLAAHERSGEFLDVPALRQIAAGSSEDQPSLDETQTEHVNMKEDVDLSFLLPSTQPGSLGRLGHYEVQEVIGRGGCGIVLKAFDEILHRLVAIKVMTPEMAATSPARKRFLREARAAASIRHENVVSIHAVEEKPIPFLVMEYIAGQTLQQQLDQKGPLEVSEVVQIGQQIASGLESAHAIGLIHRDIKPGNILLDKGRDRIKITDFGLARATDDASITQSGVIAGTPLYMSPEQAQGAVIDHRSDLFSLGSVLYVMCSGRPPFRAATTLAVLKRVTEDEPRSIQEIIPEVPEWLIAIIAKLLAKKPADRFTSAQEVANLLARCLSEMQHRGRVESLDEVLPMTTKPANAVREPVPSATPVPSESVMPVPDKWSVHSGNRRWVTAAALFLTLLVGLGMSEATGVTNVRGTVIRLFSPDGTLVVEVDDPGVSVSIDGEDMIITGTGAKEIRLKPGQYKVLASKDGKLVCQELVTVTKNGRKVVRVSKEAEPVAVAATVPDPDRRAAEYILSIPRDFEVWIQVNDVDRCIAKAVDLPASPYRLTAVNVEWAPKLDDAGLAHFQGCKHLKILRLIGTQATEKGLAHFKDCTDLHELSLNGDPIKDAALEPFKGRKLTSLLVQSRNVTDAGLAVFEGLTDLTSLVIGGAPVTEKGLAYFKDNKKLKTLTLADFPLTDAGLAHFKGCLDLEALQVFWTQVSDAGLVHFKDCKNLKSLDLNRLALVTDTGLAYFKDCTNLGQLNLGGTGVSDKGLAHIENLKNLTFLGLENTKVTDAGLVHLKACKLLGELHLWQTRITGTGFIHLKELPSLTRLYLAECPVTDDSIDVLFECLKLRSLGLTKTRLSVAGVQKLAAALPQCQILSDHGTFGPGASATVDPDRRAAEWMLSIGGSINIKENGQDRRIMAVADLPSTKFELTFVASEANAKVNDAGLANFKDCKNITYIHFPGSRVGDSGLANFKDCKKLTHVILNATQVSDVGMANFKDCTDLMVLELHGTRVGDAGLAHFNDCKNLTTLGLADTEVSDAGLANFKDCRKLLVLHLRGPRVTDSGLAHFKDCKNLTTLSLDGNGKVSDAGLSHFKECVNLSVLDLNYSSNIGDVGLAHFKNCKNVTVLRLAGSQVSDDGLGHFKDCMNLTQLDLNVTKITDVGLAIFKDCKELTGLGVSQTKVTDVGLAHFKGCKNFAVLDLTATQISDSGLSSLRECKNLSNVVLSGTKVTDVGLPHLKDSPNLSRLWLDNTAVTDRGVEALVGFQNLVELNLKGTEITEAGVKELQTALPNCKIESK